MNNILLILVGGTICTALNEDGNLAVSKKAGLMLVDNYLKSDSPYAGEVKIKPSKNLYVLSENMTIKKWNRIIDTYRKEIVKNEYDGVIIAHGTDTLAYSAAMFSMLLSGTKLPVFLVSANENLASKRTNGNDNFACAVECICRKIKPNVYVTYKNLSDEKMYIHLASRLRQCENYSEDFNSVGQLDVSGMTEDNYKNYFKQLDKRFPKSKVKNTVDILGDWKLKDCVLYINPYVGLNYGAYRYKEFSAVLHGTFHSGTANAPKKGNDRYTIYYMLNRCFKNNVDVYISPSIKRSGTYETIAYIGDYTVDEKQAKFMYGYTYEMAYAKLVIAYSLFEDEKERQEFIYTEYNHELIYK